MEPRQFSRPFRRHSALAMEPPQPVVHRGMDFNVMPDRVFEDILLRVEDVPELVGLRSVNKKFREVLLSSAFAAAYLEREHQTSSWMMIQVFDDVHRHFGILMCIEQTSDVDRRIIKIPLVNIVQEQGLRSLSLLAASGSLVLFKAVAEDRSRYLKVLNLYTMDFVETEVVDADFKWEHIIFQGLLDMGTMMYDIAHVYLADGYKPIHVQFWNGWDNGWYIRDATPQHHEPLIEFDRSLGMLIVDPLCVYKVSLQRGQGRGVVFSSADTNVMVHEPFLAAENENFLAPVEGGISVPYRIFGKDGLAALAQIETRLDDGGVIRIKTILLFQLTEDWSSYRHVATFPLIENPDIWLNYSYGAYLEEVNNVVYITFIARERNGLCGIHQYWMSFITEEWGSRYTPLHDFVDVGSVAVTGFLTVGRISN